MRVLRLLQRNVVNLVRSLGDLVCYAHTFVWALVCPRAKLAARLVALQSQVAARRGRVEQGVERKPRFSSGFRLLWVLLSRFLDGWQDLAQLMQPATVKRWHGMGFRLYWRWRSRRQGRPPVPAEMQSLIRKLSRENPLWSAARVRDTLLLLGYRCSRSTCSATMMASTDTAWLCSWSAAGFGRCARHASALGRTHTSSGSSARCAGSCSTTSSC